MDRRDLLKSLALMTGGAVIGAEFFLTGCKNEGAGTVLFSSTDIAMLDEVADTILPTTAASPGAKAAKVGEFMKVMVTDGYDKENQDVFTKGIKALDEACKKTNGKSFVECAPEVRTKFLTGLHTEMEKYQKELGDRQKKKDEDDDKNKINKLDRKSLPNHYYKMVRDMTLLGYFTSEVGCTKAQRWVPVPGKYDGAMDYKKGDKSFNG